MCVCSSSIYNSSGIRTGNTGHWKLVSCLQDMSGFISMTTAMVIGASLLSLAVTGPAPTNFYVNKQMTVEEVRQVFQADPHSVPEYEVTAIQWPKLHKRAVKIETAPGTATHIRLNAFGRVVPLWLQPTDGILAGIDTPVYYARADENGTDGVRFDKIADPMSVVGQVLEDKEMKATLVVKQAANGKQLVSGNIGSEQWTIRPLPINFAYRNFSRHQRSVDVYDNADNATIDEYDEPYYHIIYKTPAAPEGTKYATIDADLLDTKSSRSKRAMNIPSIIYPQILVVVDYASYQRHNGNTNALLEYLLLFWNAVDLRYRGLEYPKIMLNIAGVIMESDPDTLPYIRRNKIEGNKLDVYTALGASGIFRRKIESTFPSNSYDITVTMSPYDMCNAAVPGCPAQTRGLAYLGGACRNYDSPYPQSISVAIIQDNGGFDGVHYAAHELGHLFGAGHDGATGASCSMEAGYIMAKSPQLSENSEDWSPCTLNEFDTFFRRQDSVCLFNKPSLKSPMPQVLPGRLHTMDDQCMKIEGTKTCNKDPNLPRSVRAKYAREICMKLRCYDKMGIYCMSMSTAPADGSICGEGMICLHAKCIRETDITY